MSERTAVVMAAYNAEKTITQSIDSVLAGPLPCRIFVVDDCSRVPVANLLGHYGDRIEVIRLDRNHGPAEARNVALQRILAGDFDYVAIQDADDVAHPERFAREKSFLDAHPDVGVVSCTLRYIEEHSGAPLMIFARPCDDAAIRRMMYFNIGVSHAGAMIRTEALRKVGLYSPHYPAAEDYELMRRIGTQFAFANLPEALVDYRVSYQGVSLKRRRRQIFDRIRIQLKYFEPAQWRAWAGVAKAVAAFFVPVSLILAYKQWKRGGTQPASAAS